MEGGGWRRERGGRIERGRGWEVGGKWEERERERKSETRKIVEGGNGRGSSLVPRPSPAPVFDRLQYAKTEAEGGGCSVFACTSLDNHIVSHTVTCMPYLVDLPWR